MKEALGKIWTLTCLVLVVFGLMVLVMSWPVIFLPLIFLLEILGTIFRALFPG